MDTIKLTNQSYDRYKKSNYLFYIIGILLVTTYLAFQPDSFSLEQMKTLGGSYESKLMTYLFSFLIMLLCALTPLPAELIALTNTLIYSPTEAFFITWMSAITSAQIGYEFGRLNSIDPCKYKSSKNICRWLSKYGFSALAILRLIPIVPFFVLNISGGILKLDRYKYITITTVTIIPAVMLLTFFPHLFI